VRFTRIRRRLKFSLSPKFRVTCFLCYRSSVSSFILFVIMVSCNLHCHHSPVLYITIFVIFLSNSSLFSYCYYHYGLNYAASDLLRVIFSHRRHRRRRLRLLLLLLHYHRKHHGTLELQFKAILISRRGKIFNYKNVLITDPLLVLGTICASCVVLWYCLCHTMSCVLGGGNGSNHKNKYSFFR
jgi:hypothetical protein